MIDVNFYNEYNTEFNYLEKLFNDLAIKTYLILNLSGNMDISVTLVNDTKIHNINRNYRGIDKITDVISFENDYIIDCVTERDLGDVFICIDQGLRQASEYRNTVQRELSFLFIHGLLHCLGYDHDTVEHENDMFTLQEVILKNEEII